MKSQIVRCDRQLHFRVERSERLKNDDPSSHSLFFFCSNIMRTVAFKTTPIMEDRLKERMIYHEKGTSISR